MRVMDAKEAGKERRKVNDAFYYKSYCIVLCQEAG